MSKLDRQYGRNVEYVGEDATAMKLKEGFADVNIVFLLLHELPNDLKVEALSEAARMLALGGKLYLGEFHKPNQLVLKCLSWSYFKVFEPLALALWESHDPVTLLRERGGGAVEPHVLDNDELAIVVSRRTQCLAPRDGAISPVKPPSSPALSGMSCAQNPMCRPDRMLNFTGRRFRELAYMYHNMI